jgi:hypothetical protein
MCKLKSRRIWKSLVDEDSKLIIDSDDIESKVVKIVDAQNSTREVLSFMASQGSHGFTKIELLMMERICN